MAGGREANSSLMFPALALAVTINVSMLLWTLSLGIGRPNEAQVALVGIGVLAFGFAAILLSQVFTVSYDSWVWWTHPLTIMVALGLSGGVFAAALGVQLCVAALFLVLATARIGRPGRAEK